MCCKHISVSRPRVHRWLRQTHEPFRNEQWLLWNLSATKRFTQTLPVVITDYSRLECSFVDNDTEFFPVRPRYLFTLTQYVQFHFGLSVLRKPCWSNWTSVVPHDIGSSSVLIICQRVAIMCPHRTGSDAVLVHCGMCIHVVIYFR